jgi:AcrR family transcriptional regulator
MNVRAENNLNMRFKDTKQRILNAAIDLFATRGFHESSMRDIAAVVGIRAASLYSHFKSKDEILQTILELYRDEIASLRVPDSQLAGIVESCSTETILVEGFKAVHKGVSARRTERILRLLLNLMYSNPQVGAFGLDCLRETNMRELTRIFDALRRHGKIRRFDPEFLAVLYNALVNDYFHELAVRKSCHRSTRALKQRTLRRFRLLAELLSSDGSESAATRSTRQRKSSCSKN